MVEAMEIKKGFQKTEAGIIPEDWKLLSVSKFGEVKRGAGSQYIKYVNINGVRLIRINDFFKDSPVYILPTSDIMRFAISEDDVLFAGTGASAGASYIPKKGWIGLPHSYNAPRIRTNKNHSKEFLLHALQSEYISKQQRAWFVGAAQPFLDLNAISSFLIATPTTKAEQTAIATALNDTDALITQLEKLIAKKRNIKQGAMQELLKPKEGWEVKRLGEVGVFKGGSGFPTKAQGKKDENIPFYKVSDMNLMGNEILMSNSNNWISEKTLKQIGAYCFPSNTIVFAKIGAAIFLERKKILSMGSCIDNNMMGFIVNTEIHLKFIYFLFHTMRFGSYANTTALPSINGKDLSDIEIKIPLPEEQIHIAKILSDMDAEIEAFEKKLEKYKMIKQGMMQNLLTGRIRLV